MGCLTSQEGGPVRLGWSLAFTCCESLPDDNQAKGRLRTGIFEVVRLEDGAQASHVSVHRWEARDGGLVARDGLSLGSKAYLGSQRLLSNGYSVAVDRWAIRVRHHG